MLKIATVLFFMVAIACHAAPHGWRSSEAGRTSLNEQPSRNSLWREAGNSRRQQGQQTERDNRSRDQQSREQIQEQQGGEEEENSEGLQENGQNAVRKTDWQYEISHVRENSEREMKEGERRGTRRRLENERSSDQQQPEDEEEQGEEENQQEDEQSNQQEDQQDVQQIDQRSQAENQRRRQGNGRDSASRDSRRGRNEQQRNENRQSHRRASSQEQPPQKVEQINEQEDQIQEEQEVSEENHQEGSQGENKEGNGLPDYEFSYGVNDPKTGDHKDQWEKRVGDHLEGGYVLDLPDGTKQVVHYKHDAKRGFETNIMQIEKKKATEQPEYQKKGKSKNVAHSYSKRKQVN